MNSINYKTIDEYLNGLPIDEKQSLLKLRDIINSTIPDCKERISYKICVFSINKDLVGFASQKNCTDIMCLVLLFILHLKNLYQSR